MKSLMLRVLLLLAMVGGAVPAMAGPLYQVTVNTSALSGMSGYLDFLFLGLGSATPAEARLSNLSGDLTGADAVFGDGTGTPASGILIGNSTGWNEYAAGANFGGLFTFDVQFSVDAPFGDGTTLGVALLDSGFNYLGTAANIVTIALQPGAADGLAVDAAFAQVNAVPEPSALLMVVMGLILLGFIRLRKPVF